MIDAAEFIKEASELEYSFYTGVPCSFLTSFINYVVQDDKLNYICAPNEGDAVALAAGATMGGKRSVVMMQNSGLGNAVSPLTSLTYTFRVPILIICTHRGEPGLVDEPQHELMGQITPNLFETMKIPWEQFPQENSSIRPALNRAEEHFRKFSTPYALLMKKGTCKQSKTVSKRRLIKANEHTKTEGKGFQKTPDARPSRSQILRRITQTCEKYNAVILATTGFTGRELYKIRDSDNQFYMVGSMGCISSLGLGLALSQPTLSVILLDGDGAALMRLGNLATVGAYAPKNLYHFLLDNESHESTGGQPTVSSSIDFSQIAVGCGYKTVIQTDEISEICKELFEISVNGPKFLHYKTLLETKASLPRPTIKPSDLIERFKKHIGTNQ